MRLLCLNILLKIKIHTRMYYWAQQMIYKMSCPHTILQTSSRFGYVHSSLDSTASVELLFAVSDYGTAWESGLGSASHTSQMYSMLMNWTKRFLSCDTHARTSCRSPVQQSASQSPFKLDGAVFLFFFCQSWTKAASKTLPLSGVSDWFSHWGCFKHHCSS